MKRDMDLIRTLLMQVEAAPANQDINNTELSAEGYSQDEIDYHVHLLEDAGFIDSLPAHSMSGKHWIIQGLTWRGHEFLDSARNDTIWSRVKEQIKDKGGSVPFEVLQSLLVSVARNMMGLE